jgi:cytochrome c biogenesis protein CcmG/thiol:disulfide interchange protein DsbE
MNRALLFIPLAVFFAIGVLFWIGIGKENKDVLPSPLIGKPFPEFAAQALESGTGVSADSLLGQPMLVNVWATWCPTCKAEHAFLNTLAEQGIRIIGINYKDDDFKAKQWLTAYGNPYEFNVSDPDGKLGLDLGVYGAPETFLVDGDGIIRAKHVGDLNPRVWEKLKPQFDAMQ